jgi:hypothetical protein
MPQRPNRPLARFKNLVFLDKVGESLRWATAGIEKEELPQDIQLLLRRLDRLEQQKERKEKAGPAK